MYVCLFVFSTYPEIQTRLFILRISCLLLMQGYWAVSDIQQADSFLRQGEWTKCPLSQPAYIFLPVHKITKISLAFTSKSRTMLSNFQELTLKKFNLACTGAVEAVSSVG